MKVTFNINYRTNWGESLYVYGNIKELGGGNPAEAIKMTLIGSETWSLEIKCSKLPAEVKYGYVVKPEYGEWRFEDGGEHALHTGNGISNYVVSDNWKDKPADGPFYSSAFIKSILSRKQPSLPIEAQKGAIRINVEAPTIRPDQILAISGEGTELGSWNPANALIMSDAHFPLWQAELPVMAASMHKEFKFVILNAATHELCGWETGENRILSFGSVSSRDFLDINVSEFRSPQSHWKGAGTAIPVFSIRTEEDFGTGDFISLKKMIDWCKLTNQKVLQLLPVNDTTKDGKWTDSYPYNANSTFALHPLYIRLEDTGIPADKKVQEKFEALKAELNSLSDVDYERTYAAKMEYLHIVFDENNKTIGKRPDYKAFVDANKDWLEAYAAFSILRNKFGTPDMSKWGKYSAYTDKIACEVCEMNEDDKNFIYFVQYHLDRQLREARDYAHSNGVILKGDIPIGISRYSVDAWKNPRLYNMDCQAGAPPDDFSVQGQNWGFPTYNWDEMARDGFAWWKARFRKMADYFDAYRIDHVLGFFRIWQIPIDAVHGLLGYFNPALPFSPEEMRNNYDFYINPDVQTSPYIMDWMIGDFFGEYTNEVRGLFLEHITADRFRLKPFVNTQAKIEEYFAKQDKNEKNDKIREALMGLIDDVLFIEDPYKRGHYHPRIAAQFTYQYRALNDYERWCFDRLYNDFYYHRHNDFWYGKAMWKLPPLLKATTMLTCAEDLGMIPDCVPEVMHNLQILSLEIQRMPKNPNEEFGNTWQYPYYSVCTSSTHDMPGIRGWWEEDHAKSQLYFNNILHELGPAPYFAEPWICRKIVDLQLLSPSMLCILPLQDWLSTDAKLRRENPADEQINIPAISRHYWRYRMHITVEDLLKADEFNLSVKEMIENSKR